MGNIVSGTRAESSFFNKYALIDIYRTETGTFRIFANKSAPNYNILSSSLYNSGTINVTFYRSFNSLTVSSTVATTVPKAYTTRTADNIALFNKFTKSTLMTKTCITITQFYKTVNYTSKIYTDNIWDVYPQNCFFYSTTSTSSSNIDGSYTRTRTGYNTSIRLTNTPSLTNCTSIIFQNGSKNKLMEVSSYTSINAAYNRGYIWWETTTYSASSFTTSKSGNTSFTITATASFMINKETYNTSYYNKLTSCSTTITSFSSHDMILCGISYTSSQLSHTNSWANSFLTSTRTNLALESSSYIMANSYLFDYQSSSFVPYTSTSIYSIINN